MGKYGTNGVVAASMMVEDGRNENRGKKKINDEGSISNNRTRKD